MNVHVSRNGKVIGEFNEEDFRKNLRIGVIAPSDYYFCDGFTNWKSVADFKRKQALLGFTPPKTISGQIGALLVVSWFMPMIHPVFLIFNNRTGYCCICGCHYGNREEPADERDSPHCLLHYDAVHDCCRAVRQNDDALKRFT